MHVTARFIIILLDLYFSNCTFLISYEMCKNVYLIQFSCKYFDTKTHVRVNQHLMCIWVTKI